jgi:phosphatidylserine decarboxylase
MKVGSRIELFRPPAAVLSVSVGQTVRGGETILARWS